MSRFCSGLPDVDGEGDVDVGLGAAVVHHAVPLARHPQQAPLPVRHEVAQVAARLVLQCQVQLQHNQSAKHFQFGLHLEAGVGPTAKLEIAALVVKREPGDVYLAGRLVE